MKMRGILSYLIVLFFVGWCIVAFREDLAKIRFEPIWAGRYWIILAALLTLFNYTLRVLRWTWYFKCLGHKMPFDFSMLTYLAGFAFTLSPGKVGELVRGRYYQKIGIPLSTTAAAFFVERLMDLLAMLALAFLAIATASAYQALIWGTVGGIAGVLVVLAVTPWRRMAQRVAELQWIPVFLQRPVQGFFRTLVSSRALLHPGWLLLGFGMAVLAWGAEGLGLMVIGKIFPAIALDWATATSIYAIAIIIGVLSFLPGGLGGTEAVMAALLTKQGFSLSDAILLTLVCRLLTLWFAVLIGWIAVVILKRRSA